MPRLSRKRISKNKRLSKKRRTKRIQRKRRTMLGGKTPPPVPPKPPGVIKAFRQLYKMTKPFKTNNKSNSYTANVNVKELSTKFGEQVNRGSRFGKTKRTLGFVTKTLGGVTNRVGSVRKTVGNLTDKLKDISTSINSLRADPNFIRQFGSKSKEITQNLIESLKKNKGNIQLILESIDALPITDVQKQFLKDVFQRILKNKNKVSSLIEKGTQYAASGEPPTIRQGVSMGIGAARVVGPGQVMKMVRQLDGPLKPLGGPFGGPFGR